MPSKTRTTKRPTANLTKRRGNHHRHSKPYLKVYWPYVPMFFIVLAGLIFGSPQTGVNGNVLAYATEMSSGGLLSSTNAQRAAQGKAGLAINGALTSAAQAKANDMVARNYWSHNTPDGQAPWVFMDNAGYQYLKAGENLAYGFANSSDTVTGWMNSPSHRENMLDGEYTEVGFGFTNSPNYVNNGQQTVVVAMYGKPQVAAATAPSPSPEPAPPQSTAPSTAPSTPPASTPAPSPVPAATPAAEETVPEQQTAQGEDGGESHAAIPLTTMGLAGTEPATIAVSKVETAAGGRIAGLAIVLSTLSALSLLFISIKHSIAFKRVLIHGEQFFLKHPLLDIALVAFVMLGYVLNQTSGFIK